MRLISVLLFVAFPLHSYACSTIYSQDGIGFSGRVCPNPIHNRVNMTKYNGNAHSFGGGVFDGSNV